MTVTIPNRSAPTNHAHLQRHTAHRDGERTNTLAGSSGRGEERRDDVLRQGLEKLTHNTSEVERRSEDDNVSSVQHFYYDMHTLFR